MNTNEIARIAALVGEPARTAMLLELMDGRALTANELAQAGSVTPQTASRHLSQMVDAHLLKVEQQGRHRYHRLASEEVAAMLEGILQIASLNREGRQSRIVTGPADANLRRARLCYDHVAGRLGVAIAERLQTAGVVIFDGDSGQITGQAHVILGQLGLDTGSLPPDRKKFICRPCLDWSERRFHVAGRLGKTLCGHLLEQGWLRRGKKRRVLEITPPGARRLREWLGVDLWDQVQGK